MRSGLGEEVLPYLFAQPFFHRLGNVSHDDVLLGGHGRICCDECGSSGILTSDGCVALGMRRQFRRIGLGENAALDETINKIHDHALGRGRLTAFGTEEINRNRRIFERRDEGILNHDRLRRGDLFLRGD